MLIITLWDNNGEQMYSIHEPKDDGTALDVTDQYKLRALAVRTEEGTVCSGWHVGKEVDGTEEAYGG